MPKKSEASSKKNDLTQDNLSIKKENNNKNKIGEIKEQSLKTSDLNKEKKNITGDEKDLSKENAANKIEQEEGFNFVRFIKRKKTLRAFFWLAFSVLVAVLYNFSMKKVDEYVFNKIEVPRNSFVTVDYFSKKNLANGSPAFPFKSIKAALDFVSVNPDFKTVFIRDGVYEESLDLPDKVRLIGMGGEVVIKAPIVNDSDEDRIFFIKGENELFNVKIQGGSHAIYLVKGSSVLLGGCQITGTGRDAIVSRYKEEGLYPDKKGVIKLVNTDVFANGGKGVSAIKFDLYMNNSSSSQNKEEGVDLHTGGVYIIKNSKILDNGEGGIETEIGDVILTVDNCEIAGNKSSGINLQSYGDNSEILIKDNYIRENFKFGIRCAIHSDIQKPYFTRMIKFEDNVLDRNGKSSVDTNCWK